LNKDKKILTGILEHSEKKEKYIIASLKSSLPPFDRYTIKINLQKSKYTSDPNYSLSNLVGKLIIIEGTGDFSDFVASRLETMNENHFLVKLLELNQNQPQGTLNFGKIIHSQLNYIENFQVDFKDILFNMKGKVSKNLLDNLKELLLSKVLDGEVKYPYNILISKKDIEDYLVAMIKYTRDITYGNSNISNLEQLLSYIKYYYPSYKM
jgi:hypothetical protein